MVMIGIRQIELGSWLRVLAFFAFSWLVFPALISITIPWRKSHGALLHALVQWSLILLPLPPTIVTSWKIACVTNSIASGISSMFVVAQRVYAYASVLLSLDWCIGANGLLLRGGSVRCLLDCA